MLCLSLSQSVITQNIKLNRCLSYRKYNIKLVLIDHTVVYKIINVVFIAHCCYNNYYWVQTIKKLFIFMRYYTEKCCANLKSFIMSYTYDGKIYSIKSPIQSISVNKHNIVVTDQNSSQLLKFNNVDDTKCFLAWVIRA